MHVVIKASTGHFVLLGRVRPDVTQRVLTEAAARVSPVREVFSSLPPELAPTQLPSWRNQAGAHSSETGPKTYGHLEEEEGLNGTTRWFSGSSGGPGGENEG